MTSYAPTHGMMSSMVYLLSTPNPSATAKTNHQRRLASGSLLRAAIQVLYTAKVQKNAIGASMVMRIEPAE